MATTEWHVTCRTLDTRSHSKRTPKAARVSCSKAALSAAVECFPRKKGLLSACKCSLQVPREWPRCRRLPLFGLQQHGLLKLQPIDLGRES